MSTEQFVSVTDSEDIAVVHHEASTDEWIFFCHGFLSDKSGSYQQRCERAVVEGYNAVRFDFRGCGDSDGAFVDQTLSSKIADLQHGLEYFDPDSYVLFGSSFGGKVAFHTAVDDERVTAVVTRAPVTYNRSFDELRSQVATHSPYRLDSDAKIDSRFFEDLDRHRFADVTGRLECPVAIFHGGADDSVDPADSFRAGKTLETEVLIQKFQEEDHRFSRDAENRLRDRTFEWLETVSNV